MQDSMTVTKITQHLKDRHDERFEAALPNAVKDVIIEWPRRLTNVNAKTKVATVTLYPPKGLTPFQMMQVLDIIRVGIAPLNNITTRVISGTSVMLTTKVLTAKDIAPSKTTVKDIKSENKLDEVEQYRSKNQDIKDAIDSSFMKDVMF